MTSKELLEEKAFFVLRDEVHQVAEGQKLLSRMMFVCDEKIPYRMREHLKVQSDLNGIIFRAEVIKNIDGLYTHLIVVFRNFDQPY